MALLRIGAVPYLNARPLTDWLEGRPGLRITRAAPARLWTGLGGRRLDWALLPAFEAASHPGLFGAEGVAIGSDGPVRSVLLYCRRGQPERIRTLALDPASRSSNALVRILLAERYGARPRLAPAARADAVLAIGDRALKGLPGKWTRVLDLGLEWKRLSGLPFVFAFWAARRRDPAGAALLRSSARHGRSRLAQIARQEGPPLGIPAVLARPYLRTAIRFGLGAREKDGLRAFLALCRSHRLLRNPREPEWI